MKDFHLQIILKDSSAEDVTVIFDTGNYRSEKTIEFDGYPDTAKDIQDWLLGEVARLPIEDILKRD